MDGAPFRLLDLRTPDDGTWRRLLSLAEELAGPAGRQPLLAGRRIASVFFNPSLRTRTAMEVGAFDLGAHAVYLQPGGGLWGMAIGDEVMDGAAAEHVAEGFGVLGRMCDLVGVRAFAEMRDPAEDARDPLLSAIAAHCPVPLLSLESAMDHPHQGIADALTVRQHVGERCRIALTWAPHVKPLPRAVPHAALLAFAREGHEIHLAHPEGFDLDEGVLADARRLAEASGARIEITHDQAAAVEGARIVYVKSWGPVSCYGDPDAGAAAVRAHPDWCVDEALLSRGEEARVMHCLPVRRDVVIRREVLEGPRSLVLEQAALRLPAQKATLCHALGATP